MDSAVFLLIIPTLALALVALILAVIQTLGQQNLTRRVDSQLKLISSLRAHLEALEKRFGFLERRDIRAEEPAAEPQPKPGAIPAVEPAAPPAEAREALESPPAPPRAAPPQTVAAPRREEIERQFGTRVVVWLGAVALALSGAFLVKYTFERGLIGPAARVTLGLIFGVALLVTAEWLYRRAAGVARGLAAAGIAVLYSALLAGVRLYELIPPTAGFTGMALATAIAVALALRHGQIVAILGLLGGFLTPILIGAEEQHPWQLLFYLVLLQIALLYVGRKKAWWPVAGLTLLGVMGWAALWLADLATIGGDTLHIGLLLMASIVSIVIAAGRSAGEESWCGTGVQRALVWCGAGIGIVLLSALVGVGDFGLQEWAFLGIVGAGCIVLGRMDSSYEGLAWLASIAAAGMLMMWGVEGDATRLLSLWSVAFIFATLYVGGSYIAMWGSVNHGRWAALASLSGVIYLLAAYVGFGSTEPAVPWGVQALILAAIFAGLASPVARRRESIPHGDATLAALVVGVTTLVSLAIPLELERAWITVAWAVEVPVLAWIAGRLRVPQLQKLAWLLSGVVAMRLLVNPAVFRYPIGDGVLFNWLLYGYGVPTAAFAVGATIFRRSGVGKFADLLEAGSMALGFVYLTLSIRQFFHPGNLAHPNFGLAELGAFTVIWLLYGLGLLALHRVTARRNHMLAGASAGIVALIQGLLYQGLFSNPLIHPHEVGTAVIFNKLLFAYGLPAVLAALLAKAFDRLELTIQSWIAGGMALVFGMLTLSLEVRQAFQGNVLYRGPTTNAEMYTYSLVWVLFAMALLVAGIATRGAVLRYGSAAVMALAVCKVFLVDTAQLEDLYRVFSLLGLGVTLMVLAYLYQKFVFRE